MEKYLPTEKKDKAAKGKGSETNSAKKPNEQAKIQEGQASTEKEDLAAEKKKQEIIPQEPTQSQPSPDAPAGMWHASSVVPRNKQE